MARRKLTTEERFKRWHSDIFVHLEKTSEIKDGNGAIVALTAAMPLYERWLESEMSKTTPKASRASILKVDLGITTEENAQKFWNVFRDGLCHTGAFFAESGRSRSEGWTLPKIGVSADYPDKPLFKQAASGEDAIFINPWGLIRHILKKYENNVSLMESIDAPMLELEVDE